MEVALTALRQFSLGAVSDATVYRTAAAVSAAAPAPVEIEDSQPAPTSEESLDNQASPELLPHDGSSPIVAFASSPDLEAEPGDVVSELYTWGRAKNYQLGFGASGEEQPLPRLVPMPRGISVKSISCGQFHSVAVTSCGSVFCWGFSGTTGRLGLDSSDGAAASCIEPSRLSEFGPGRHLAVKVAAGLNHSLAATDAGLLLAWGSNAQGQLGLQGARTGEGAVVQRPQPLKGALKGEVVIDIAAGAAHSLCCIEAGAALAWGSNERGALGLGAPPAGPAAASSPQRLPHLKGTRAVFASAAGHVCAALVTGHGDALIFGSPSAGPAGRGAGGAGGTGSVADARHFVPSRVIRRRGRGGAAAEGEAWQTAQRTAAPLRALVLGTEAAFGVDTEAVLWTWPLRGPRPCSAEDVVASAPADAGVRGPPPLGGVRAVAVADRLGAVWAIDSTPASRLWRLKQAGDAWTAERSEHLAQVSSLACGPEHQAAIVTFRRPEEALPPPRTSPDFVLAVEGDGEESEDEEEGGSPIAREVHQPVTLQQLCEEKLCREMSPRSLGMLCEAALEFDRPVALDRAFAFLRANAALMFSKQHLPVLSQLPVEILAAFELVAAGQFPTPSMALEAYSAGFPFDDMPTVPEEADPMPKDTSSGSLSAKEGGALKAGGQRRKRRGAAAGGTPKLQESATPQLSSTASPAAKAAAAAAAVSPGLLPASPAGAARAAGAPRPARSLESPASGLAPSPAIANGAKAASPKSKASPDAAVPKDWVEVQNRPRRKAGSGSAAGPGSPGAPLVPPSPGPPAAVAGATSPQMESLAPPAVPMRPMATLGDFVRAPAAAAAAAAGSAPLEGPSAVLSAAVQSIRGERPPKAAPWAVAAAVGEPAEAPKLRDIIKEEGGGKGAAGAGARGPASAEATTCSWGRDAMPSEKPKGRSVYEIQQQEEVEKEKLREDDEIREIEAMFAALEVAERADAEEQSGPSSSSSKPGPKAKKASAKQPAAAKPPRGGGGDSEKGQKPRPQHEPMSSNDEKWSREGWNSRARGRGGGGHSGWDAWSSSGWNWSEESWQWSESAGGGGKKWKAKKDDGGSAPGEEPPGS